MLRNQNQSGQGKKQTSTLLRNPQDSPGNMAQGIPCPESPILQEQTRNPINYRHSGIQTILFEGFHFRPWDVRKCHPRNHQAAPPLPVWDHQGMEPESLLRALQGAPRLHKDLPSCGSWVWIWARNGHEPQNRPGTTPPAAKPPVASAGFAKRIQ